MGFEIVRSGAAPKRRRSPLPPYFTINKHGVVRLNRETWEALGSPTHVQFVADTAAKRFGIRAASVNLPAARKLTPNNGGFQLSVGRRVLEAAGLTMAATVRYEAVLYGDVLAATLPDATEQPRPA